MSDMRNRFPGLSAPVQDMQAVRDRRRTGVLYFDVDLSTSRSLAAGTALVLPIAGSVLYIDQRANTGYATVHLVDETFSAGNTPITVFSGYILRAPFTQLVIENAAQAGQSLRILYGIDIDFVPGSGAGVTVTNPVNVLDVIDAVCRTDRVDLSTAVGANQVQTLLSPAANARGVRIRHITQSTQGGAGGAVTQWLIAASAAPASIASQANAVQLGLLQNTTAVLNQQPGPAMNREIPPAWGVYAVSTITVAIAGANSVYWSYEVKP